MLTKALADDLRKTILRYCPFDSGALSLSITDFEQYAGVGFVLTIGNGDTSVNGTASNTYASRLNYEHGFHYRGGKHVGKETYHWVNKAIKEWAMKNKVQLAFNPDDEEEEENE